jgi:hypothetical protein
MVFVSLLASFSFVGLLQDFFILTSASTSLPLDNISSSHDEIIIAKV